MHHDNEILWILQFLFLQYLCVIGEDKNAEGHFDNRIDSGKSKDETL